MNTVGRPCMPGTRVQLLKRIDEWFQSKSTKDPNVLILLGHAGIGKTTVATAIRNRYLEQLGSCHFFKRGKGDSRLVFLQMQTQILAGVGKGLDIDPRIAADARKAGESYQDDKNLFFQETIVKLLQDIETKGIMPENKNILIILDAIDEYGDDQTRERIIRLINDEFPKLPKRYRFLITSRLKDKEEDNNFSMELNQTIRKFWIRREDCQEDVAFYIERSIEKTHWESSKDLIVKSANGLFIHAATIIGVLQRFKDEDQLLEIPALHKAIFSPVSLPDLYEAILRYASTNWIEDKKNRFRSLFSFILFSKENLSFGDINQILEYDIADTTRLLDDLHPLIMFDPEQLHQPIIYHDTLHEFLTRKNTHSCVEYINEQSQKKYIAKHCFDVMKKHLRFNILNLETSYIRNSGILDLEGRINGKPVKEKPPLELLYTCLYWTLHLKDVAYSDDIMAEVEAFSLNRLLFWFEILSLSRLLLPGYMMLKNVIDWLGNKHPRLTEFLSDARLQISYFSSAMDESIPHIYVSFLSLMKDESIVAKHYTSVFGSDSFKFIKKVATIEKDLTAISVFTISPNGAYLVSGSNADSNVCLWKVESGELKKKLQGHSKKVNCVAFSSDNERFASGSEDGTVRIWDIWCMQLSCIKTNGSWPIISVSFSDNGVYFASKKGDNLNAWYTNSYSVDQVELKDCVEGSKFLYFSSDGNKFVSVLPQDSAIFVWNTSNKSSNLHKKLIGHSSSVICVHFSHDSSRLVSGSEEETIVWDTGSGQNACRPIKKGAYSVCFSRDAKWVATTFDESVYLWDASTGRLFFESCIAVHITSIVCFPASDSKDVNFASLSSLGGVQIWSPCRASGKKVLRLRNDGQKHRGWLEGSDEELYIWFPRYIRCTLIYGACIQVINTECVTRVDFSEYDGRWTKYFTYSRGKDIKVLKEPTTVRSLLRRSLTAVRRVGINH